MTAEQLLYDAIATTGYEIFPQYAPDNQPNPYIIYLMVTDTKAFGLDETPSTIQDKRFQIDIYADGYAELLTMKDNVLNALIAIDKDAGKVVIYDTRDSADEYGRKTIFDIKIWVKPD